MRITVFNDTDMDWNIHSGSVQAVSGTHRILRHTSADFDGSDGCDPFVKVWNGVVMVRFLHSNKRQPPLSDGDRMNIEAAANLSAAVRDLGGQ